MAKWFKSYRYRFKFTIDNTKIDAALTDFPVALLINSAAGTGDRDLTKVFDVAGARWTNLAVCGADGETPLWTEVDLWDATGESGVLHVRVPKISSSADTDMYLYFDADGLGNGYIGATGSAAAQNVWDENYVAVYHLSTVPTSANLDSTSNGRSIGSVGSMTTGDLIDAQPGKGLEFDGSNDLVYVTASPITAYPFTLEAAGPAHVVSGNNSNPSIHVVDRSAANQQESLGIYNGYARLNHYASSNYFAVGTELLSEGAFCHIAAVCVSSTERSVFTNGGDKVTDTDSAACASGLDTLCVGGPYDSTPTYIPGTVSEARFSDIARSDAWMKATYYTLADDLGAWSALEAISEAPAGSWLSDWQSRIKFTIASTLVDANLTDFPVALALSATAGTGSSDLTAIFDALGANSHKIAVTDHTGIRQLFVEVDSWDSTAESAVLHTKVPHVDADTDTILYLYFDAAKGDNDGFVGDTGDAAAQNVWDENFVAVWHLSQDPTGGAGCIKDSTSNGRTMSSAGSMTSGDLVDGKVGKSVEFDGSNDHYVTDATIAAMATLTAEMVHFNGAAGTTRNYLSWYDNSSDCDDWLLVGQQVTTGAAAISSWVGGYAALTASSAENQWLHTALTFNAANLLSLYVNGALGNSATKAGDICTAAQKVVIGGYALFTSAAHKLSYSDEVRLSNIARSAAWLKATYHTLFDTLGAWSEAETYAGLGWLRGFTKRAKVIVDSTLSGASLDYFPVTLFLSASCGTGDQDLTAVFDEIGANSKKIAITAADGKTQLPVEIDYWDETGEEAVLHVRVPSMDYGGDTYLYLYYSADVPDNDEHVGDVTEAPAMSVWDDDYETVYHMNQDPSATTVKDSTVVSNHATSAGTMLTEDLVAAAPGQGLDFDGSDDYVRGSGLGTDFSDKTVEVVAKFAATSDEPMVTQGQVNGTSDLWNMQVYSDNFKLSHRDSGDGWDSTTNIAFTDTASYHYFAGRVLVNAMKTFLDDASTQTGTIAPGQKTTRTSQLNVAVNTTVGAFFSGIMSEVRVSRIARSDAWIKASYYSLFDGLVTYTTDIESEDNWLGDWANRIQIRIDSSKIDADLTDFPVAIHLGGAAGINGADLTAIFDELGANNLKLAVATAAGAQCYVEIDTWDETGETAVLHTKIPTVYAGRDTIFYLYYDSAKADNSSYVGVTGSTPGQGVWDANFDVVYHFSDPSTADGSQCKDSTANAKHGSYYNTEAGDQITAPNGKGVSLGGTNEYINSAWGGTSSFCAVTGTMASTLEAVSKASTDFTNGAIIYFGYGDTNGAKRALRYDEVGGDNSGAVRSECSNGYVRGADDLLDSTWRHTAAKVGAAESIWDTELFVNGALVANVNGGTDHAYNTVATHVINIGRTYVSSTWLYSVFSVSEVRISTVERSAAWLKATYHTLFDALLSHGAAETLGGGWLRGWKYRRAFTIPSTNIDANLTDFPLALILNTSAGTGDADISSIFDEIDENSKRIAVCAAHGDKQVPVEIDTWDGASEAAVLHAKVPLITAADGAVVYVYYDDDRYDDGFIGETGEAIAQRVWDENFDLVNHFGDKDASKAGTNTCYDSSRQANHGTYTNTDAGDEITGQIGKGVSFDGTNEAVAGGAAPNITGDAPSTIEVIGKCDAMTTQTDNYFISFGENSATAYRKRAIRVNDTTAANNALRCEYNGAYGYGANNIDDNAWHHLVFAQPDGGDTYAGKAYVDGASAALTDGGTQTTVDTTIGDADDYYQLAREWDYSSSAWKYGAISLCEVRVSTVERSAAWLKATYNTLFDTLAAWGAEGEEPGDEPTTIEEPLSKAGRIDFTPHSLTDVLSMTEALSKAGRIDFTPHSLSESYTGNLLKMVDASGSRPKILTATGTKAKISAASGARPRLAAAEAYEYQERE